MKNNAIQKCREIISKADGDIQFISNGKFDDDEDRRFVNNILLQLEAMKNHIRIYQRDKTS
jgi:hypothetical protein